MRTFRDNVEFRAMSKRNMNGRPLDLSPRKHRKGKGGATPPQPAYDLESWRAINAADLVTCTRYNQPALIHISTCLSRHNRVKNSPETVFMNNKLSREVASEDQLWLGLCRDCEVVKGVKP